VSRIGREFEDNIISLDVITKLSASHDIEVDGLKKGQWIWMVKKLDSPHHLLSIAWHESGICLKHTNAVNRDRAAYLHDLIWE
jgi:hypothetical protein